MRYRYFCAECPNDQRYGPWRNLVSHVARDIARHRDTHPDHYPYC